MEELLYDKIKNYTKTDAIPMHMPGHKRSSNLKMPFPYNIDITEIDGFDNLHSMQGLLKERCEIASKVFKVKKSYFLINGSTGGILSAIYSQTNTNDKVIVARNCHKSVFNAIEIRHLKPVYFMPTIIDEYGINGKYDIEELEKIIESNQDAKCVIITSPTYEGIVSDIKQIASLCHKHNILLIVDEAHGAHLGFDSNFPKSARSLGADIVINSLHKTLPALTQCAILHICTKNVNILKLEKALSMFETSSPSYILMCSIDACVNMLKNFKELFLKYNENLDKFYNLASSLQNIKVVNFALNNKCFDFDKGKIIISTKNSDLTGSELAERLRKNYKIEVEMASLNYVICMTSICDTWHNFKALANALKEIDKTTKCSANNNNYNMTYKIPKTKYSISEAINKKGNLLNLNKCLNKVSLEFIWVYPPGIPLIIPGDIIDENLIKNLTTIKNSGLEIKSDNKNAPNKIFVSAED